MKIHIPKIALKKLNRKETDIFHALNSDIYDTELASEISKKLMQPSNNGLYFFHRDYCGIGLFYHNKKFILSTVYDGHGIDKIITEFDSQSEFINWLSKENDQSMSLFGEKFNNQTITRLRLNWFLDDNYSPVWNSYCMYAKKHLNN